MIVRLFGTFLVLMVVASPAQAQPASCSPLRQVMFVQDVMSDVYLWRNQVPRLDPASFASPEAYLETVRVRPLDASYSYVTSRAASEAFFSSSRYDGFGFSSVVLGDRLVVSQVFPASPAADAGMRRGDRVLEIAGQSVSALLATGGLAPVLSASTVELLLESRGVRAQLRLTRRSVVIPSVGTVKVLDVDGRRLAYVLLRNFVEPTVGELDEAFRYIRTKGIDDLVLDLRYNGGGLVGVAQHLAGLIGGSLTSGQVFARYRHNDRHTVRDRSLRFPAPQASLRLDRLFVITTRATASASELLINGLRPFLPVILVGDRTFGKPVGQYLLPFCDRVIAPVSFSMVNANGDGDFFEGLQPACQAGDGLDHELGDIDEASLREVIAVVRTGRCSPAPELRHVPASSMTRPHDAWSSQLGAH